MFDLLNHAAVHRLRTRNLHDGGPVPPARHRRRSGQPSASVAGYIGADDRMDAVVGRYGYTVQEGGFLDACFFFKSRTGVNDRIRKATGMGGEVLQEGDTEVMIRFPLGAVTDILPSLLKMIQVYRRAPGNPGVRPPAGRSPGS